MAIQQYHSYLFTVLNLDNKILTYAVSKWAETKIVNWKNLYQNSYINGKMFCIFNEFIPKM